MVISSSIYQWHRHLKRQQKIQTIALPDIMWQNVSSLRHFYNEKLTAIQVNRIRIIDLTSLTFYRVYKIQTYYFEN